MSAAGTATAPSSLDHLKIAQRAFASAGELDWAEMLSAPVRWPRPSRLRDPLDVAPGKLADGLATLRLTSVGALLEHLPRDSREARTVSALKTGEGATVAVQVRAIAARPVRRRGMKPLVEATVFDATGTMRAMFFNQPWLVQRYEPGTRLVLHGKTTARGTFNVANHALGSDLNANSPVDPTLHRAAGEADAPGEIAHYPATEGVSSTQILTLVQGVRDALADVPEALSAATRVSEGLPDRRSALAAMHFPRTAEDRETGRARLAFEELLLAQLVFLRRRAWRRARRDAFALSEPPSLSERWLERELPFKLTGDQRRAVETIRAELASTRPMQRLLMGEVGSGKTVVALYAMLRAVEHGRQAALMAPTETLAEQHFATLQRLIGGEPVPAALLTGATAARRRADILGKLESGELGLIVGTHALIEPDVNFRSLAVAVVDEQHRFGVRQRAALDGKGAVAAAGGGPIGDRLAPHVLHMTATPIPRTLALAGYGDLDVSRLRELPRGRQAIATRIVAGDGARERAYEELREQLRAGRQAYVVCPLVEETQPPDRSNPGHAPLDRPDPGQAAARESGSPGFPDRAEEERAAGVRESTEVGGFAVGVVGELRAATAEYERLAKGELEGYELVLLHGGMRPREKQAAMARFAAGEADVLVATTVIEVGVDVANATVMLVENAERFGLSQLHQLRGRVGRGEHSSKCLLVGPPGARRLRAMVEHGDGFKLAEIDLELRSEGELVGTRQSGLSQFAVACLPQDGALLERARAQAEAIVATDPELARPEHVLLGEALAQAFGAEALEPIPA
ncbi:MAG TPA: ATP-dependent DNA helicase RecG [Solirubrobacteraceae bacterium]